jgi:hypothetical protein
MHRFINLLYYIIFLPGLFLFGEDRNNIDIFYVDNILFVQTNFFERQFKADNTSSLHSFYPISWTDKSTDAELLSGENKDWFKFCLENVVIESKNGGWDYLGYKKGLLIITV